MAYKTIPYNRLMALLDYSPETGIFCWINSTGTAKAGDIAGSITRDHYITIGIDGNLYQSHRLAWSYMTKETVFGDMDHIDHNKYNNRFNNLRVTSKTGNNRNASIRKDNNSGVTGVCWHKRERKWRAQISISGRQTYIGSYGHLFDAIAARKSAEYKEGFHKNHGKSK